VIQPEWIMGIAGILAIILITFLRTRREKTHKEVHPGLTAEHHIELNGLQVDEEAIRQQLRMGNKINAIKMYRVQTGVGLKEAKKAVEIMAQEMQSAKISELAEVYKGDDAVEHMLITGNKINAIKLYRQRTGVGLKEAKEAVEAMGLPFYGARPVENNQPERGQIDPDELRRLVNAGQKIQAIKYYREITGVGLKEAKDAVDWLEAQVQKNM
jgi:ribosomal protein L7/L12